MKENNPLSADKLTSIFRTSGKDPLRIVNREGTTIEFKESYSHAGMAQYFKTMAAYANNAGGYIIFGVADKPRRLIGLKEKNLKQFEELKVEEFTKNLLEYFSPEIKWDHCTFEYKDMSFGVIYTEALRRKPCVCRKSYEDKNSKYSLKEGDIFYRYGGRSERIKYGELAEIIDEARRCEERQWLEFARRAAKIGVDNACLLDLETGKISGNGGTIVIDETLLEKIAFIKEGEFVEVKGKPALRLIGDVEDLNVGRIVVHENTKKVVRAIEPNDIVKAFLLDKNVDEPMEYIRTVCSESTANYPIYYYIEKASATMDDAMQMVERVTTRSVAKKALLSRLGGKRIEKHISSSSKSPASLKKEFYKKAWETESIKIEAESIHYCINAVLALDDQVILKHKKYIKEILLVIFENYYENVSPTVASNLRKAICRIDEVLYFKVE